MAGGRNDCASSLIFKRSSGTPLALTRPRMDAQQRRWGGLFEISLLEESDIPLAPNGKRKLVISELCA